MHRAIDVFDALFPPASPAMRQWRWVVLVLAAFFVVESVAQVVLFVWRRVRR